MSDPSPSAKLADDLNKIDLALQDHGERAAAAIAEVTAARLTHRDAAASEAFEQQEIDTLLKKTIVFLTSANQELQIIASRLTEVTKGCKNSADQEKAATRAAALSALRTASPIMTNAQTYDSPDQVRKALADARAKKLKYNQRMDQVSAAMKKFPRPWVTSQLQQSLTDADTAAKKADYVKAFDKLQTALTDATNLAGSYKLDDDLKHLDAELTTFLGKAKAAAAEVAKVQAEHKLDATIGDEAERAEIDKKIPLATAFLPNADGDYKRLSEHLEDVNRLCTSSPHILQVSTLVNNLFTCMQEIGPLLKAPGEFYALDELRSSLYSSLAVAKPAPAVAAKFAAETTADTKALASAARIHQAAAKRVGAVPQMQIVHRGIIKSNLEARLTAVVIPSYLTFNPPQGSTKATSTIPRTKMLQDAATAASKVFQEMLKGCNSQAEQLDLMLVIATDDLDGLLKSSMPPDVNWAADPTLLGELADATRKELAKVITNHIEGQGEHETAQIGTEIYDFKQELGRGGLGIAKLFESKKDPTKKLVLKEPQTRANSKIPSDIQYQMVMASNREMANELRAHLQASQSNHPNVLKLVDLCIGPDGRVRAVMEVAGGGDVPKLHRILEALSDLGVLPQAARTAVERDMAAQMLSGIAAMHGAGVVHHDLKGENVFLKADGTVQVADFGAGVAMTAQGKIPQVTRDIGFTKEYAPEHPRKEHDEAFDIFTVGKILERDVGMPGEPGSPASSAARLREALTRSDADKRADLEAAAKTAYIAGVDDFRNMQEYKNLLKEIMAAGSTAVGKFLKARSRLVHSLDICRCEALGDITEPIATLAPDASVQLSVISGKIQTITGVYYTAVIEAIEPLSVKDFKPLSARDPKKTLAEIEAARLAAIEAARLTWVSKLRSYQTQFKVKVAEHKALVQEFVSKYQEVLGSLDWDALRTAMGGSKSKDKEEQKAIQGLAKAEMRLYGVLAAFDEVSPRIEELLRAISDLVQAINDLVQAKPGELETIREAGKKFIETNW